MTAKQQAIQDIKDDLRQSHKCFIAFQKRLNPVMRKLVNQHLSNQTPTTLPFNRHAKTHAQLMARCFYSHSSNTIQYTNYQKYYHNEKA